MSKKFYSDDIKTIKRPNIFFKKFGIFFLSLIIISALFFGGYGLANLLTKNNFTWFRNDKIVIKSLNFYLLNFGEFDNEEDAKKCATWTASVGGSAYVYKDKKYIVAGQLYSNIDNANTVKDNLNTDLTYLPNIMQFKTKNVSIKINNISNSDKKNLDNDIKSVLKICEKLLKIDENMDKNLISNITAGSEVNILKSEIKICRFNIDAINSTYNNEYLSKLSNQILLMEDSLDMCVNKLLTVENNNNSIKYTACEIFFNYYDFSKNFVS